MSGEYDVGNYGIFSNGVSTAKTASTSIATSNDTLENCRTQLSNESIFMGPICDSCVEGLVNAAGRVANISANLSTVEQYLIETSSTYQAGDDAANKNILQFSGSKITVGTSSGTSVSNSDVQNNLQNIINGFDGRWGSTGSSLGYSGAWCAQYAWDVVNGMTDKFDGYSNASTGYTMGYFIEGNNDTSFHYNTQNSVNAGESDDYTPKAGDFVFFEWGEQKWNGNASPNGNQDHTGLVVSYGEDSGGAYIETLEGNISGKQYNRKVYLSEDSVIGFGSWY